MVKTENVIDKVVFTIPYVGYIGYFVRTPIGFTLLIVIPATLLITIEIRKIIKYQKQNNQKKQKKQIGFRLCQKVRVYYYEVVFF